MINLTIKKTINIHRILFLLILIIYFITRITTLINFPLFFDEAIYIHWAQYIADDSFWKWTSLADGKQPLPIWLMTLAVSSIHNPIIAARIVSFVAGLASIIGIFFLAKSLFNTRVGLIASFFYSIIPFFVIYDSLALYDSILLTFSVYTAYFSIKLAQKYNWFYATILGIFVGLGLLTKSSAQYFLTTILFAHVFFTKATKKSFFTHIAFIILALLIAFSLESIMRLSSYYEIIAKKNAEFSRPLGEIIPNLGNILTQNGKTVTSWITQYLSISIVITSSFALIYMRSRKVLFLAFASLFPILITVLVGQQLYPRHFLFMTWPIVIMAAVLAEKVQSKYLRRFTFALPILVFAISILPIFKTFTLLAKPEDTKLPEIEKWQFFTGEPSGVGIDVVNGYFSQYTDRKVLIMADKPLGILPDGIAINFHNNKNFTVVGADSIQKADLIRQSKKDKFDYVFVVTSWQSLPPDVSVEKVLEVQRKGARNHNWNVYKLPRP